ncbi:Flagellar motor switch protein FliM [Paraburkholderia unamae]|nr:Flagellar motor switch protein FliM [Paraburkholderia unamae]
MVGDVAAINRAKAAVRDDGGTVLGAGHHVAYAGGRDAAYRDAGRGGRDGAAVGGRGSEGCGWGWSGHLKFSQS